MNYQAHVSAIIDEDCTIGNGTKIWHFCHIMGNSEIGENCNIGQNVFVASKVKIGNSVKIQNNVSVYEGVVIEEDVFIGPSVVFTNIKNPRSFIGRKGKYQKTLVKKGATIGANATIICGNTIGTYAMIGAGTVITKDIPDFALVVGNPGRQTGWISKAGHRLEFDKEGVAVCPEMGEKYKLCDNVRVELINCKID